MTYKYYTQKVQSFFILDICKRFKELFFLSRLHIVLIDPSPPNSQVLELSYIGFPYQLYHSDIPSSTSK